MNLNKYFFLSIVFLISFFSSNVFKYHTSILTNEPDSWEDIPIVVNCYLSAFTEERINKSIDFWKNNKFDLYLLSHNYNFQICKYESLEGFILIKKAKIGFLDRQTLGLTKVISEYGKIKSATIYLRPGTFYFPFLLEHELGHSLGIDHIDETGNVMNPIYDLTGNKY